MLFLRWKYKCHSILPYNNIYQGKIYLQRKDQQRTGLKWYKEHGEWQLIYTNNAWSERSWFFCETIIMFNHVISNKHVDYALSNIL